jgi:hypothetical protein
VRTRTWLTTPPGLQPTDATGRAEPHDERYVSALDLPAEPQVPSAHRRTLLVLGMLAAVLLVVAALFLVGTASQSQDPALSDPSDEQAAGEPVLDDDGEGPSLRG